MIDYKHLYNFFPKIKKLYLGGTSLNNDSLNIIIENYKNLEIIDISLCKNLKKLDKTQIDSIVENSKIKKIYATEADEENKEEIWTRLNSLPSTHMDFNLIESWFANEIDVNIFPEIYQENDNFISKLDEDLLIEIFGLLIYHGLDKWYHRCYSSSLHFYNCCNFLHEAAFHRKIKLFWYLFDKNFPMFHCYGNLLFDYPEIINGLYCNPSRPYYIPNSLIYEAVQFYIKFKNKGTEALQLIEALVCNKIQLKEIEILKAQWGFENNYSFVKSLLTSNDQKLGDINTCIQLKKYPLMIAAAIHCQPEIIKKLISHGFDANIENWRGKTALFYAVSKGYNDIVQILCKSNANVNKIDSLGKSPIYKIVKKGNDKAFKLLINFGADLNNVDTYGFTLMDYAKKQSQKSIVKMIEKENNKIMINRYLHNDAFNESNEVSRQI